MSRTYSIRDLADEFDVTTRTLRFYEEKGLLKPKRDKQSRIYSSADRTRLRLVLRGKRLGLTLEESSSIISMYTSNTKNSGQLEALIGKIQEKRAQLLAQKQDLDLMLEDLADAETRFQASLSKLVKK